MKRKTDKITEEQAQLRREVSRQALREQMLDWRRAASSPQYATFRLQLLEDIRNQGLRPFEVAAVLERENSSETDPREIAAYKRMGTVWKPWQGFDADYA